MSRIAAMLLIMLTLATGVRGLPWPGVGGDGAADHGAMAEAIESPVVLELGAALPGGSVQLDLRPLALTPALGGLLPTPSVVLTLSYVLSFGAVFWLVLVDGRRRTSIAQRRL